MNRQQKIRLDGSPPGAVLLGAAAGLNLPASVRSGGCGGKIEFDSSIQKMKCPYCDNGVPTWRPSRTTTRFCRKKRPTK